MNWRAERLLHLAIPVLLAGGLIYWDNQRVTEAEARADRAEETARLVKETQAELVWHRVDCATEALKPQMEEPSRKEALERLRQEIQRLKNHFRFKKLEAAR